VSSPTLVHLHQSTSYPLPQLVISHKAKAKANSALLTKSEILLSIKPFVLPLNTISYSHIFRRTPKLTALIPAAKMAYPKIETPPGLAPTHDFEGYFCLMENISRNIVHNISRAQSEMSRTGNANSVHHEKGKPTSAKLSSESCPKVSAALPKAVWLISIVSLCERFSYYSLVGPLRESRSISQPYAKDCG